MDVTIGGQPRTRNRQIQLAGRNQSGIVVLRPRCDQRIAADGHACTGHVERSECLPSSNAAHGHQSRRTGIDGERGGRSVGFSNVAKNVIVTGLSRGKSGAGTEVIPKSRVAVELPD